MLGLLKTNRPRKIQAPLKLSTVIGSWKCFQEAGQRARLVLPKTGEFVPL